MILLYVYIALVIFYMPSLVAFWRDIGRKWDMVVINTAMVMLIFPIPMFWLELLAEACSTDE